MKKPKVTVLLPTYRRPVLIRRALNSIFEQTLTDYELIVIENGSDEEMHERYQAVIDDVPEVNWLTFDWASLPKALNEGLNRASGEFLAIMEDDDEWKPEFLDKMSKHLENCTCGMVYCRQSELRDGQKVTGGTPIPKRFNRDILLRSNFIGLPMVMYRTKAVRRVGGFDERAGPATDWITHCLVSGLYDIHELKDELVIHHWQPENAETPNYCLTTGDDYRFTLLQRRYWAEGRFDPR